MGKCYIQNRESCMSNQYRDYSWFHDYGYVGYLPLFNYDGWTTSNQLQSIKLVWWAADVEITKNSRQIYEIKIS